MFVVKIRALSESRDVKCHTLPQAKKIMRAAEGLKDLVEVRILKES